MDPLANMLNGIKNAGRVQKSQVTLPYSKFKAAIAHKLFEAGYVTGHEKKERGVIPYLTITLAYNDRGQHKISEIKAISKQSCRVYYRVKDIKSVKYGKGQVFLSTPKGVLLGKEAREQQVGGEALFEIW
jgi:small subunit ribosomal protein S8